MTSFNRAFIIPALAATFVAVAGPALGQPEANKPFGSELIFEGPTDASDKADELHNEGLAAGNAGKLDLALQKLTEAFALKQSYDIAGNLGALELAMKKYADAATHLSFSLRVYPRNQEEKKKLTQKKFAEASKHVAALNLTVAIDGATVKLDGNNVDSRDLAHPIFVDPGKHVVTASAPNHIDAVESVTVKVQETTEVQLSPTPIVSPPSNGPNPVVLGIGFGVAGASAIAGAVMFAVGSGQQSDAEALEQQLIAAGGCSTAPCTEVGDAFGTADASYTSGGWLLMGAVIVALGTGVYALVGGDDEPTRAPVVSIWPVVSPEGAGLGILGAF